MNEYSSQISAQKTYNDVIRERLLIPQGGDIHIQRSPFAVVPSFGVDARAQKYLIYTKGTLVLPSVDIGQQAFNISLTQIKSLIESEPVEAGMDHPAMDYLQSMIGNKSGRSFLKETMSNGIESWLKADILLCFTGLEFEGYSDYLFGIAAEGLKSDDVRVRDAAVQALEAISMEGGDKSKAAIWLLEKQIPSEKTTWLRDYAEQIVSEYQSQK